MNATAHPFTPEEIMAFLDGELPVDRSQSIFVHTESCPSCHQVLVSLRSTSQSLSSWTLSQRRIETMAVPSVRSDIPGANWKLGEPLMLLLGRRKLLVGAGIFAVLLIVLLAPTRSGYMMKAPVAPSTVSNVPPPTPPSASPQLISRAKCSAIASRLIVCRS